MALESTDITKIANAIKPIIEEMIDNELNRYHATSVQPHLEAFHAQIADLNMARDEFEQRALSTIAAMKFDAFFAEAWKRYVHAESDRLYQMEEDQAAQEFYPDPDPEPVNPEDTAPVAQPPIRKVTGAGSSD